jgi:signal transduction histidine kinase
MPLVSPSNVAARALRLVVQAPDPAAAFTALHHLVAEATGAYASSVLEIDSTSGGWRVTSSRSLPPALREWLAGHEGTAAANAACQRSDVHPVNVYLDASAGAPSTGSWFIPIRVRLGATALLLVVGNPERSSRDDDLLVLADAFALAVDRQRLEREVHGFREATALEQLFAPVDGELVALDQQLTACCERVCATFRGSGAAIWLYSRDTRELAVVARTGTEAGAPGQRISVTDPLDLVALACRQERIRIRERGGAADGIVPLRGRRRALGALVVAGIPLTPQTSVDLHDQLAALARPLAGAIENAQLLDDVRRSHRRLSQTQKMAALGQFIAGIAHELNNPLQGVLGHLELVRTTGNLPRHARRDLAMIYREADRAARIVRDLLLFAGSGRLTVRPVRLNLVVARTLRLRSAALREAGIEVVRAFDPRLPRVKGDNLLIQQALLNIIVNAEQAMAGPGRLTVATRRVGEGVAVVIQDSGPGLNPDVRSRLFEPFFTTKEVGKGTGLGLAIAYGIAQAHGGTLDADNHPAGGAQFVLTLPGPSADRLSTTS